MIDAKNITARHGDNIVVDGVSFMVEDGASFGIVGESGSGKSTLLRVIAGLHRDWTGELIIANQPQTQRRPRRFGRVASMVFQDPYGSLHPRQTVDRALSEPLLVQGFDRDSSARSRGASRMSGSTRRIAFAIRISFPAASVSASLSPAR